MSPNCTDFFLLIGRDDDSSLLNKAYFFINLFYHPSLSSVEEGFTQKSHKPLNDRLGGRERSEEGEGEG